MKEKTRKKKVRNRGWIIFVAVLLVLYIIIYVIPKVTGALVSTYTVEYGELTESDQVDGYFVRNEKVFTAGNSGEANFYFKNEELVRQGTRILDLTISKSEKEAEETKQKEAEEKKAAEGKKSDGGDKAKNTRDTYVEPQVSDVFLKQTRRLTDDSIETKTYLADMEGLVSFYCDGNEGKLTPQTMVNVKKKYLNKLDQSEMVKLKRKKVIKREPIFKMVDRSKWYVVFYVSKEQRANYEEGNYVILRFGGNDIGGFVNSVSKEDGEYKIIVESDIYFQGVSKLRAEKVEVITDKTLGLILENASITKKKGVEGVYRKNKIGDSEFVPVNVIAKGREQSVVSKKSFYDKDGQYTLSIDTYDEILKNPDK